VVHGMDVPPPLIEALQSLAAVSFFVRDVVDRTAKAIDLEHGVALLARKNAHRGVKRTAGGAVKRFGVCRRISWFRFLKLKRNYTRRREPTRSAIDESEHSKSGEFQPAEVYFFR